MELAAAQRQLGFLQPPGEGFAPLLQGVVPMLRSSRSEMADTSTSSGTVGGDSPYASRGTLFESLRPDLVRFARWLARDRVVAEDVVQEALLRAWRSRGSLRDPNAARAWLLTIVRREYARLYERKRLELVPLDEEMPGTLSAEPESEPFVLRHAMMQLPSNYREPLALQVLGGFSTDEIARELALSSTAVLTRLSRARDKLRAICGIEKAPVALGRLGVTATG